MRWSVRSRVSPCVLLRSLRAGARSGAFGLVFAACQPSGSVAVPPAPTATRPGPAGSAAVDESAARCAEIVASLPAPPSGDCTPLPVAELALDDLVGGGAVAVALGRRAIDLGTVPLTHVPAPSVYIDLGPRSFVDLLDAALPAELATPMAALRADENALRDTQRRAVVVEAAARDCSPSGSERCDCLAGAARPAHDAIAGARSARSTRQRATRATLEAWSSSHPDAASAATWHALATLRWREAEELAFEAEPEGATEPDLGAAREAFDKALALAPASDVQGWIARYALGTMDRGYGHDAAARAAFEQLAAVVPAEVGQASDVELWLGQLAPSPGSAIVHFEQAVKTAVAAAVPVVAKLALFSMAMRAQAAGELRRGIEAGARLAALTSGCEDEGDFRAELGAWLGFAIDRLGPAGGALPKVAAPLFPYVGLEVAKAALARGDVAAAVHAWRALLRASPDALQAGEAMHDLAAERRHAGDDAAAASFDAAFARDYGPQSAWAARHDAALASTGSAARPPFPPAAGDSAGWSSLAAQLLGELADTCALRVGAPPDAEVEVTVAPGKDGLAVVTTHAKAPAANDFASCVRELGRGWLRGLPITLSAVATP